MHYRKLIQSNYIAATDFDGKTPTLTIASVTLEGFEDEEKKTRQAKGVVVFKERPKAWILNRTNIECLRQMFGDETDGWIGKRVTLRAEKVHLGRELVDGIRVAGSPDLERPITFKLKLPKKKPRDVTLAKTTTGRQAAPAPTQAQEREPGTDDDPVPEGPPDDWQPEDGR